MIIGCSFVKPLMNLKFDLDTNIQLTCVVTYSILTRCVPKATAHKKTLWCKTSKARRCIATHRTQPQKSLSRNSRIRRKKTKVQKHCSSCLSGQTMTGSYESVNQTNGEYSGVILKAHHSSLALGKETSFQRTESL